MAQGKATASTQMPTLISDGLWMTLTTTGAAAVTSPSATAVASGFDQRPTTKPSSESSNMSGSRCPARCAATTGTSTAAATSASGAPDTNDQTQKAATGIAVRT